MAFAIAPSAETLEFSVCVIFVLHVHLDNHQNATNKQQEIEVKDAIVQTNACYKAFNEVPDIQSFHCVFTSLLF